MTKTKFTSPKSTLKKTPHNTTSIEGRARVAKYIRNQILSRFVLSPPDLRDSLEIIATKITAVCSLLHLEGVPVSFLDNQRYLLNFVPHTLPTNHTIHMAIAKLIEKKSAHFDPVDGPTGKLLILSQSTYETTYHSLSSETRIRLGSHIVAALCDETRLIDFSDPNTRGISCTYGPQILELLASVDWQHMDLDVLARFSDLLSKAGRYLILIGATQRGEEVMRQGRIVSDLVLTKSTAAALHI